MGCFSYGKEVQTVNDMAAEGKCLSDATLAPLILAVVPVGFMGSVRFLKNSASWKGLSAL